MFFICDHCHYVFSANVLPHRCPDCGDLAIRHATTAEKAEHVRLLEMVDVDDWDDTLEHCIHDGDQPKLFKGQPSGRGERTSSHL